jgi:hypothetical protein
MTEAAARLHTRYHYGAVTGGPQQASRLPTHVAHYACGRGTYKGVPAA